MDGFKERLLKFSTGHLGMSNSAFEESCEISHGTITSIKVKGPSVEVLARIATAYPELNLNWLVVGRGEMLLPEEIPSEKKPSSPISIQNIQTVNIGNWDGLVEKLQDILKK